MRIIGRDNRYFPKEYTPKKGRPLKYCIIKPEKFCEWFILRHHGWKYHDPALSSGPFMIKFYKPMQ